MRTWTTHPSAPVVLVLAIVVASCLVLGTAGRGVRSESASTPDPDVTPSIPVEGGDRACGGERFDASAVSPYAPETAAYSGTGPHPVVLFKMDGGAVDAEPRLPADWLSWRYWSHTQLVVCQHLDDDPVPRVAGTCFTTDGSRETASVALYSASYVYRVFEARTGEPVTTFRLAGSINPCGALQAGGDTGTLRALVSSADLADRLRPWVEGDAPG
ncbi:hypothetical protein LX16_3750 [Stackebrandtia albiflava]|uniref:Uncharacterized protein n=1 Tax=Stackebrandtia albiflava TaxID=406432 RepID=A0A562V529_9ACTN|nr:hypothetical protein [Stackebrandtia albiflava]TWJ12983.1 hypothetical protein LX16_3750 [Stackebrandtia albiflava]